MCALMYVFRKLLMKNAFRSSSHEISLAINLIGYMYSARQGPDHRDQHATRLQHPASSRSNRFVVKPCTLTPYRQCVA